MLLLFLTLGMAFSGQVLRWDADAYWGVGVGASMAGRVPVLGPYIVDLLLGGPVIGGDTLSRFFALHVFVIPGLLLPSWRPSLAGAQARHQRAAGTGEVGRSSDLQEEYEKELKKDGVPFFGDAMLKDASVLVVDGHRRRGPGGDRGTQGARRPCPSRRCWARIRSPIGRFCGCSPCCR